METYETYGKTLNIGVFVPEKNLKKLEQILEYLNSLGDVQSGEVPPWTETDVYELLFNDAIKSFPIRKSKRKKQGRSPVA